MSTNEYGEEVEVVTNNEEEQEDSSDNEEDEQPAVEKKQTETVEAKRARLTRQLQQLDKKHPAEKKESKPSQKSDSLDYGEKAFLVANGIKGQAEMDFVQEVMQETGKTLEQVLDSKFFKAELEDRRELARTANATPSGKRSGSSTTDSVEYWLGKPIEDVPKEMRAQVVNARIKQDSNKGVFYNS